MRVCLVMAHNRRYQDLTGARFGRLAVLGMERHPSNGRIYWRCRCDCGAEPLLYGPNLTKGATSSCGCLRDALSSERRATHRSAGTRLHRIWVKMRKRCRNPEAEQFKFYGARGINICPEWDDFTVFRDWALAHGYRDDLTIERGDVDGSYSPQNCSWIPASDQSANRRCSMLAPDGQLWLHKALANGINRGTFYRRKQTGWPMDQAVTWPMGKKRPRRPPQPM